MEQKGGKVRRKVLFNKGLRSLRSSTAHDTAVAKRTARLIGRKRFWGGSCKDHEPKKWRSGVTAFSKILADTQRSVPHCISTDWHPLRWTGGASGVPSRCVLKTECGTHTQPLCGALALEEKERTTERAALKGQERKIGVAKREYLALD